MVFKHKIDLWAIFVTKQCVSIIGKHVNSSKTMDGRKKRSQQTFYDFEEEISRRRLLYLAVTLKNLLKVTILFLKPYFCIPYFYGRRRSILKTLVTYISCMEHQRNTKFLRAMESCTKHIEGQPTIRFRNII